MSATLYDTLSLQLSTTPVVTEMLNLLNVEQAPRWKRALCRIAQSMPYWSMVVPTMEDGALRKKLPDTPEMPAGYRLVSYAGTYGTCVPAAVQDGLWPYLPQIKLTVTTPSTALLEYGSKSVKTHCFITNNLIVPVWPEDTGIKGAIECEEKPVVGQTLIVPALLQYPCAAVIDHIKNNDNLYALLDKYELADPFHFADSPEEQLSLIVLAIYKEVNHV